MLTNFPRLAALLTAAQAETREFLAGRMAGWLWITIPAVLIIALVNVEAVGGIVRVLAKITLGAWLGYRIDRAAFRDARPHQPLEAAARLGAEDDREGQSIMLAVTCAYMLRRAAIIGACVIAAAIGV